MVMFDQKTMRQEYTLSIDGENLSGAYASVNIANGPCYGGDKNAVITAVPDDGFMDVLMFKSNSALRALTRMLPYAHGRYERFPGDFTLKRGKIISIRSKDPLTIDLDGEAFLDTDVTETRERINAVSDKVLTGEYARALETVNLLLGAEQ
jgi:diacylglycerol kinase family enzyme